MPSATVGVEPAGYPRELIRTVLLDWGATLRIRPIRPDDEGSSVARMVPP